MSPVEKTEDHSGSTSGAASRTFRAFFSYAHADGAADPDLIEALTKGLEQRVNVKFVNDQFEIWRDAEGLRLADKWEPKIEAVLQAADILIVLLTPRWLGSKVCRSEYRIFAKAEAGRSSGSPTAGYVAAILARDVGKQKRSLTQEQAEILTALEETQYKKVPATDFLALSKADRTRLIDGIADDIEEIIERLRDTPAPLPPLPAIASAPAAAAEVPRTPEHFVGRDKDVTALVDLLLKPAPSCAILIQGPGGIGKTALTKAIANHERVFDQFGEATRWFVELERATTAIEMHDAITRALGADPQSGFKAALALLRQQPGLLVLDNLETPWDPTEQRRATEESLASLAAIPGVAVLASFRGRDRVGGPAWARVHPVERLQSPFDRELFCRIANAVFDSDPDLPRFLSALEGIPLAIELVAQRAFGLTSLTDLWKQWTDVGSALAIQPDFKAGRLTSLPHSIELSLKSSRMDETAHRLFRLLGQLPAGIVAEDRNALLGTAGYGGEEALRRIGLAIERDGRLDLLSPIRDHARRHHLTQPPDGDAWPTHYLNLVRRLGETIGRIDGEGVMTRLVPEFANITAAIRAVVGEGRRGEAMAALFGFGRLAYMASIPSPVLADLAGECRRAGDVLGEANCTKRLGDVALARSDHDAAKKAYDNALPLFRKAGNVLGETNCIGSLGDIALRRSDHDAAKKAYDDALPLYRKVGDVLGEANCIKRLGDVALRRSDNDAAKKAYDDALPLYRKVSDVLGEANCIKRLGDIALRRSDNDAAKKAYDDALPLYRKVGDVLGEANCIKSLGDIALRRSDNDAAKKAYDDALLLYRKIVDVLGEANCIQSLGDVALRRSDHDAAKKAYDDALPLYRKVGDILGEANCIGSLGDVALRRSDHDAAKKAYDDALPLFRKVGDILGEANCIYSLGDVALARFDHDAAKKAYDEALPLYRKVGDILGEANCIKGLGDIALARSDNDFTRKTYQDAIVLYRKIGNVAGEADCNEKLGRLN